MATPSASLALPVTSSTAAPPRVATPAPLATCFHCGDALGDAPIEARVAEHAQRFCCSGCAAAAQWIHDARLDDYYRLRSDVAGRVTEDGGDYAGWDRASVLAEHARVVAGGCEITVVTDGMRCAACAWLIDHALHREPGVIDAGANAVTGRVVLRWDPARTSLSALMRRMAALGYRPWLAGGEEEERARRDARRTWLLRLGVAGLGSMQAMMFAEALYLDSSGEMSIATRDFFRWITFLVASPVVFYSGWPFLEGAWRELRARRLGMDTLVAGATLLAYGASLLETVRGGAHVWFDAAVMFVFLLLLARALEQRARGIASAQVDALAHARPALAIRERADGQREQVPVAELLPGDVLRVAVGDTVPADGVLLDAAAAFDESLLTGEAAPVRRAPSGEVLAGSVCREGPARVRVRHVGRHTRLAALAALVTRAQAQRPRQAALSERIAAGFVLGLLLVAAGVWTYWHLHAPERALEVTLALLVISCPCALALAIPAALTVAQGRLARRGVLTLGADALETLACVDTIAFDKTGTLATGAPVLGAVQVLDATALAGHDPRALAAALERDSRHPLAQAFRAFDAGLPAQARELPGQGMQGEIGGWVWRIGRAEFAAAGTDDGALWLGREGVAVARFEIEDTLREGAAEAVAALHADGLGVVLLSGDGEASVARLGARLGIAAPACLARQSPEQKLAHLHAMQRAGRRVAMVGDGINDAPVLAGADVSFAVAEGAAMAQRAADFVLTSPSLARIGEARRLALRTQRVIRQNLAWALGYNLVALPLAAAGWVTPWIAAIGMALSSLTVTLNALRLTRDGKA